MASERCDPIIQVFHAVLQYQPYSFTPAHKYTNSHPIVLFGLIQTEYAVYLSYDLEYHQDEITPGALFIFMPPQGLVF